jgi:four helix bundle protein
VGLKSHREFIAWQLADDVRRRVFNLTNRPAFDRQQWIRMQLRKAAHSSCTNIAEGFGRFRPRDFARFVEIARGSMEEVIEHLAEPGVVKAAPPREIADLLPLAHRARGAMIGLILYLKSCDDRGQHKTKSAPPTKRMVHHTSDGSKQEPPND